MLVAVHPNNKELHNNQYPMCFNQGQLLHALSKNQQEEVLLDEILPGHLRTDDLIVYIRTNFPSVQISLITIPIESNINLPVVANTGIPAAREKHPKIMLKMPLVTGLCIIASYFLLTFGSEQNMFPLLFSVGIGTTIGVILLR